jgi:nucleoside-diphosphate-sugar epimerase
MRVTIIGGTQFIGRHIVERLVARGDDVLVVHRGRAEPADFPACTHLHVDRRDFVTVAAEVAAFRPDAVVDSFALTAADVDAVLPHLPDVPLVVLSSLDVYRAYELLLAGTDSPQPIPIDEDGALRIGRYPYRGRGLAHDDEDLDNYDKLDVEPAYLARGGTVLRLAMIYGPRDPQRREEFVLRRVRAGRRRIPVGAGATVLTRLHVDDAASAVLAVLDRRKDATGQVFNIGEAGSYTIRGWMRLILDAAGSRADFVTVADDVLPEDLRSTRTHPQHLLVSSAKAMRVLGWRPAATPDAVARSVRWHLANPPAESSSDFGADDAALAQVVLQRRQGPAGD